jgi:hypothetical protein
MLCATPDGIFTADDEAADDIVILVPTFGLRLIFGVAMGAGLFSDEVNFACRAEISELRN